MIIYSETHRDSLMRIEGNGNRLNLCKSLEIFRMRARKIMTFRQALNKINNMISDKIKNIACRRQLQDDVSNQDASADSKLVVSIAKETCHSPKWDAHDQLA